MSIAAEEQIDRIVTDACLRAGVWDRDAAAKLLDRSVLVYDDRGTPLNVLEAFDAMLEQRPYLRKSTPLASPAPPRQPRVVRGVERMSREVARARRVGGTWIA